MRTVSPLWRDGWTHSPFPFRGCFCAWGFSNGQWTYKSFAQKAKAAGYSWAALELDDFGNSARWGPFRANCLEQGIAPGIWVTEGLNLHGTPEDAHFMIAELESESDYRGIMECLSMGEILPPIPRAVITHFGPIDPGNIGLDKAREKVAPLIEAGFHCLTEAYLGDNPNATPDNLDFRARQLGWPRSSPVFGVYNKPASAYENWFWWEGSSDYLAENLL